MWSSRDGRAAACTRTWDLITSYSIRRAGNTRSTLSPSCSSRTGAVVGFTTGLRRRVTTGMAPNAAGKCQAVPVCLSARTTSCPDG